jgi:hypothetical protein
LHSESLFITIYDLLCINANEFTLRNQDLFVMDEKCAKSNLINW